MHAVRTRVDIAPDTVMRTVNVGVHSRLWRDKMDNGVSCVDWLGRK